MKNKWYEKKGPEGDVVISTRVRFARNLADFPFPGNLTGEKQREIVDICARVLSSSEIGDDFQLVEIEQIPKLERQSMVERHLISLELANGEGCRATLLNRDESISIMVNEEDHLRIQVMGTGLCLEETLQKAVRLDGVFDSVLKYAFDENLGYLTKCPTNLGAGMRASVMLHLPALTESGAIRALASNAGKLGFAVRGMYGEGSTAKGSLYQISNQMSLGFSEQAIIARLSDAVSKIIEQERKSRKDSYEQNPLVWEDRIWRSAGLLKNSRIMAADEALSLLSDLLIGQSLGILQISSDTLGSLLWEIQPASLTQLSGSGELTAAERDEKRASYLRKTLTL